MGKIKQGKRINMQRNNADPIGNKMPLADEIQSLKIAKTKSSANENRDQTNKNLQNEEEFINEKMSARILKEARKQQSELQDEYSMGPDDLNNNQTGGETKQPVKKTTTFSLDNNTQKFKSFQSNFSHQQKIRRNKDKDSDDSDSETEGDHHHHKALTSSEFNEQDSIEINEQDEKAFEMFMSNKGSQSRRTIADIIMEKLTEKKTEINTQFTENDNASVIGGANNVQMCERVTNAYTQLKEILQKYRSGKLPKMFKIIPTLSNWEQVLYLTEPDSWSAAAVYQATRIFASNLNAKMAQRFNSMILLPRIRDDIAEYKRLNFHLYMAVKKCLFKPAAFFKGILLPLCESRDCTLREAIVLGSILAKSSVPMLHSAAALLKLAEMEYSGANSIFIRILLDKKYALPYRVVDAVVFHFVKFQNDSRDLPVLWHQSLLTFVQRYKGDISTEQKEALLELIKKHTHHEITNEIRRELSLAKCRDLENDDNSRESIDFNFDE